MTLFVKLFLEMLLRVQVFAQSRPHSFAEGSPTAQLIHELRGITEKLSAAVRTEASHESTATLASRERARARTTLKNHIGTISRAARGLAMDLFWVPRDGNDRALVRIGQLFAADAEPLRQEFVNANLAPDFIEQLNVAVDTLDKAIGVRTFRVGDRQSTKVAVDQARLEAQALLQRLDPLMLNLLQNDLPALAFWQSARRVERRPRAARKEAAAETGSA